MNRNDQMKVATDVIKTLLEQSESIEDMLNVVGAINGMVACGLAFSVKGKSKLRRKAFQVQTDIAKMTRRAIENQSDEALPHLTFTTMFVEEDDPEAKH